MLTRWNESQNVFRGHHRHEPRLGGAVQCGHEEAASLALDAAHALRAALDETAGLVHVLNHLRETTLS
jgi:hypothetical protein